MVWCGDALFGRNPDCHDGDFGVLEGDSNPESHIHIRRILELEELDFFQNTLSIPI